MEYAQACFCGNALPTAKVLDPSACNTMACTGNATEKCGGDYTLFAYRFQCDGPRPAPAKNVTARELEYALTPTTTCEQHSLLRYSLLPKIARQYRFCVNYALKDLCMGDGLCLEGHCAMRITGKNVPLTKAHHPMCSSGDMYDGIFTRLLKKVPSLDWYWVWTPEGWYRVPNQNVLHCIYSIQG